MVIASSLSQATTSATCLSDSTRSFIISCGVTDRTDFIATVRENSIGDLKTIFAHYGLTENEYDRFASNAKSGKSYPNGEIKVDNKVVATGGRILGRVNNANSSPVVIGATTYYERALGEISNNEYKVLVLFDSNNQVEFVVMNSCGNPIRVDKPEPKPAPVVTPVSTPKPVVETKKYPKIEVQKTVGENRGETISVNEGDEFTYYIVVKNTGDTKLTEIKIYDKPSTRITFLKVSKGNINDNVWTYTIGSLDVGEEVEFTVNAKLTGYNSFSQVNKVCVDAKELSAEKDDCDTAWVKPTKQEVKAVVVTTNEPEEEVTTQKKGEETTTEVPKTGPTETIGTMLGLGSLAGASYYWRSGRRSYLKSALLGR